MEKDPFVRELVKQQAIVQKNRDTMNKINLKHRRGALSGLTRAIVMASNQTEDRHEKEMKEMKEALLKQPLKRKLKLPPPAPVPPAPAPAPAPFSEANIEARGSSFRVRVYKDGQRVIKSFKTITEAKAWRDANK